MENRDPVDRLYEHLRSALALDVIWGASGPVVPAKAVGTWLEVLNDFDESFLLCFDLMRGRRPFDPPPPIPPGWGIVTHVGDAQLDALLDGKTTDLHVHLSGNSPGGRGLGADHGFGARLGRFQPADRTVPVRARSHMGRRRRDGLSGPPLSLPVARPADARAAHHLARSGPRNDPARGTRPAGSGARSNSAGNVRARSPPRHGPSRRRFGATSARSISSSAARASPPSPRPRGSPISTIATSGRRSTTARRGTGRGPAPVPPASGPE